MAELTAQRTLVKSPPELWAELSEVESLAKHLGELGEIRITKTKPETTVAWEGEQISGTVVLEQSGWGTKVTFHANVAEAEASAAVEEAAPEAVEPAVAADPPEAVVEPEATAEPEATEPEAVVVEPDAVAVEPAAVASDAVEPEPEPKRKRHGFLARWLFRERSPSPPPATEPIVTEEPAPVEVPTSLPEVAPEPLAPAAVVVDVADAEAVEEQARIEQAPTPEPEPEPATGGVTERVQQVLDTALENLGQAHHRPFSRG